ncbi:hypothetical protein AB6F62_09925 [Providencia huaxiensis]|uniref:hypothetical protein n=1 Tax=Providencia huaxiensis TaxID=2027290 RepID=UPI0034DCD41A
MTDGKKGIKFIALPVILLMTSTHLRGLVKVLQEYEQKYGMSFLLHQGIMIRTVHLICQQEKKIFLELMVKTQYL